MPFPLFQFLSQPVQPNANGGVSNAISGLHSLQQQNQFNSSLAEQQNEFGQTHGLNVRRQDEVERMDRWGQDVDKFNASKAMIDALSKGDYATAHAIAQQLGILGMPPPEFTGQPDATAPGQTTANDGGTPDNAQPGAPSTGPTAPTPGAPPTPSYETKVSPGVSKVLKKGLPAPQPPADPGLLGRYLGGLGPAPEGPLPEEGMGGAIDRIADINGPDQQPWSVDIPKDVDWGPSVKQPDATQPVTPAQPMSPGSPGRLSFNEGEFRKQHKDEANRLGAAFGALPLPPGFDAPKITAPAATKEEQAYAIGNALGLAHDSNRHPRGGGGSTGAPFKAVKDIQNNYRAWVSEANKDQRVAAINQYKTDAEKALGMLAGAAGLPEAQRLAVAQTIKTYFGAAASEGERAFILGGEGMAGRIEMWINSWVKTGEMPAGLLDQLRKIQQRSQKLAQDKVNEIASDLEASYMNSPEADTLTPDQKQRMGQLGHSALGSKAPGLSAPKPPKKLPKVFQ